MEDSVIFNLQLLSTSVVEYVIRESCGKLGFVEQMECANYNKVISPLHLLDIGVVHSHHTDNKYCDCSSYQCLVNCFIKVCSHCLQFFELHFEILLFIKLYI